MDQYLCPPYYASIKVLGKPAESENSNVILEHCTGSEGEAGESALRIS